MHTVRTVLLVLLFILVDGFLRGAVPTLATYWQTGVPLSPSPYVVAGISYIVFDSWLYIPVVLLHIVIAELLPMNRTVHLVVGLLYGLGCYLGYYYLLGVPAFEQRNFGLVVYLIQYPLFGLAFGYFYYQKRAERERQWQL